MSRQDMMDQLGIRALRPGNGGNEKAPNHANCDESNGTQFHSNRHDMLQNQ